MWSQKKLTLGSLPPSFNLVKRNLLLLNYSSLESTGLSEIIISHGWTPGPLLGVKVKFKAPGIGKGAGTTPFSPGWACGCAPGAGFCASNLSSSGSHQLSPEETEVIHPKRSALTNVLLWCKHLKHCPKNLKAEVNESHLSENLKITWEDRLNGLVTPTKFAKWKKKVSEANFGNLHIK